MVWSEPSSSQTIGKSVMNATAASRMWKATLPTSVRTVGPARVAERAAAVEASGAATGSVRAISLPLAAEATADAELDQRQHDQHAAEDHRHRGGHPEPVIDERLFVDPERRHLGQVAGAAVSQHDD